MEQGACLLESQNQGAFWDIDLSLRTLKGQHGPDCVTKKAPGNNPPEA